jgi:G:T-mismatch repair DNA endonuclease (very short patch repair protein)
MIDKSLWHTCQLCQQEITDLATQYGGGGIYYPQVFKKHLEIDHDLTLNKYFDKYIDRPECPCGVCNQLVNVVRDGGNFRFEKYRCGRNPGILKWSEEAKVNRRGEGNPMYGKQPWNEGLTKDTHPSMMSNSIKNKNKIVSDETKRRQSESAKKRTIHGHTGHPHTEEAKEKCRQATLRRIKNGEFKQTKTKPHIKMAEILASLGVKFEEEKIEHYWCFDFHLSKYDIYLEVDGDYFHSNPKTYPDGPKTKTQKVNWYRDIKKQQYCVENDMRLIRFWECDILNNQEEIKCQLRELLGLNI